ncbi:hypothetical protein [Kocuria sp. TGY1127_2]|uniref:hypothetical protein n=1 Tax=Kocuria sp. TGY1127_2 TaxID=2711328 RepID=UPI0015B9534A|nr:hypothetical protein [Kocuria sp. TGY1127_2]
MMNIGSSRTIARSRSHTRVLLSLLLALLLVLTAWLVLPGAAADDASNRQSVKTNEQTAEVSGPRTVDVEGKIRVEGRGWKNSVAGGARIAVKYDKGTVAVNGESVVSEFEAGPDGTFSAELPFPTKGNSDKPWLPGTNHMIHFLSGSLKDGDLPRNAVLKVSVSGKAGSPASELPWVSATSSADSGAPATIDVAPFTTGEDSTLHLVGKGWKTADGKSGSIVSIKVNYQAPSGRIDQYSRGDQAISDHLASLGKSKDPTSWVLLIPKGSGPEDPEHGLYTIDPTGSFDITVKAPDELRRGKTGQYMTITAQSGRNLDGDVQRRAVTAPIPVNGKAAEPIQEISDVQCTTQASRPTARIENKTIARGEKVHLVGEGWCNPGGQTGAPKVAVKLDDGAISRRDEEIHSNKTIWALVDPDPSTGVLDTWIALPDGTTSTSSPAFSEGGHTLRLLSGSLRPGDLSMSFGGRGVLDFTLGEYRPNDAPPALGLDELSEGSRRGVRVNREGTRITVEVPGGQPRQWVRATPYAEAAPRSQWGNGWTRLDSNRSLSYDLPDDAVAGDYRLVVQSGESEDFGSLLGWDLLTIPESHGNSQAGAGPVNDNRAQGSTVPRQPRENAATVSGNESRSEQTSASAAAPVSAAAVREMTNLGRVQDQNPRHARVLRVLRAPAPATHSLGHQPQGPAKRVAAALQESPKASHHTASPSVSPSARSQARNSQDREFQEQSADGQEATFIHKVFTWNNVLLALAGALLLAVILYSTRKPSDPTSETSEE